MAAGNVMKALGSESIFKEGKASAAEARQRLQIKNSLPLPLLPNTSWISLSENRQLLMERSPHKPIGSNGSHQCAKTTPSKKWNN